MQAEKLIELVKQHPELYDLRSKNYLNSKGKKEIWRTIGLELKQDASVCKARWINIRDQHRKSLNKTSTKSGQPASFVKKYKYSELLQFLQPTFEERPTITNIQVVQSENVEENVRPIQVSKKRRRESSVPPSQGKTTAAAVMMEHLLSNNKADPHPMDAFLTGLGPCLKSLPPLMQNAAKGEIFAVVQKYERMFLSENEDKNEERNDTMNSEIGDIPESNNWNVVDPRETESDKIVPIRDTESNNSFSSTNSVSKNTARDKMQIIQKKFVDDMNKRYNATVNQNNNENSSYSSTDPVESSNDDNINLDLNNNTMDNNEPDNSRSTPENDNSLRTYFENYQPSS